MDKVQKNSVIPLESTCLKSLKTNVEIIRAGLHGGTIGAVASLKSQKN
jgi:hypothetical protein